jgi:hypothetical protein
MYDYKKPQEIFDKFKALVDEYNLMICPCMKYREENKNKYDYKQLIENGIKEVCPNCPLKQEAYLISVSGDSDFESVCSILNVDLDRDDN